MNIKKILILGGVGLLSGVVGIVLPTLVIGSASPTESHAKPSHDAPAAKPDAHAASSGHDAPAAKPDAHAASSGHGGGGHGGEHGEADSGPPKEGPSFLHFDEVVVNLNEPNLIRYLSIDISVQTDWKYNSEVKKLLEERKPMLKTWLISHLADKTLEDIRGKVGVNKLRREIQDNFNLLMFKDGQERIQDIMFEEHHVQ